VVFDQIELDTGREASRAETLTPHYRVGGKLDRSKRTTQMCLSSRRRKLLRVLERLSILIQVVAYETILPDSRTRFYWCLSHHTRYGHAVAIACATPATAITTVSHRTRVETTVLDVDAFWSSAISSCVEWTWAATRRKSPSGPVTAPELPPPAACSICSADWPFTRSS
jgi:hypothetical protein